TVCEPQMGRPATGTGRRHIVVRLIRRRQRIVGNDDRRAVVTASEGDARNIEFEARMIIEMITGSLACGLTGETIFFEFRGWNEQPDRIGKTTRVGRVTSGDRLPLGFIAGQQSVTTPALEHGSEFPAKVDCVLNRGVVTESTRGREKMRRIAAKENAATLKF